MTRWKLPFLLALLISLDLTAQTRIGVGLAGGAQPYENDDDDPKVVISGDVLLARNNFGVQTTLDYASLSDGGGMTTIHPDLVYTRTFANDWMFLVGAGPTFVNIEQLDDSRTWNAVLEVGRSFSRADVFARVRHYDYDAAGFRAFASPGGPLVQLGVRWKVR